MIPEEKNKTHPRDYTTSRSAKRQDRMVTHVPEKKEVPTPPQPRENMNVNKNEGVNPAHLKVGQVTNKSEKKMTLLPPKKKDNPTIARQYKKKNEFKKDDPNQKKISNLFKPIMKTTSSIVDKVPSNIDIYMEDNNFEDDLTFEDNLGCSTVIKKDRGP